MFHHEAMRPSIQHLITTSMSSISMVQTVGMLPSCSMRALTMLGPDDQRSTYKTQGGSPCGRYVTLTDLLCFFSSSPIKLITTCGRTLSITQERGYNYYPFYDMFRPFEPSLTRFKSLVLFTAGRSGAVLMSSAYGGVSL
jgi:hypothetical protein